MLAKRRALRLNGVEIERTPLLIPSFSSKGFPEVKKIVEYSTELIEDVTLVSAYDLHYGNIELPPNLAPLIFLDSGGYEASKDAELSDYGDKEHVRREWNQKFHEAQLVRWDPGVPSVLISYDHPDERISLPAQIERARAMAPGKTGVLREFLIKPETTEQIRIQIEPVLRNIHGLAHFDVIGVTEKELGPSIIKRMRNIAKLRIALNKAGLDTPIHVFGSLDTVTTPMYFLAGADIFDGLTWLRFAFHEGLTIYKQNYGGLKLGVTTPVDVVDGLCWNNNYRYMKLMELEMRRFLQEGKFECFKYHPEQFREACEAVVEAEGA